MAAPDPLLETIARALHVWPDDEPLPEAFRDEWLREARRAYDVLDALVLLTAADTPDAAIADLANVLDPNHATLGDNPTPSQVVGYAIAILNDQSQLLDRLAKERDATLAQLREIATEAEEHRWGDLYVTDDTGKDALYGIARALRAITDPPSTKEDTPA